MSSMQSNVTRVNTRGFSLVELLAVIGIIALLLGILLPVVGGARSAARDAVLQSQLTDLKTAITQFQTDENRYPGYFSVSQMGLAANEQGGLTMMENIMIDLAGGVTADLNGEQPTSEKPFPDKVLVGPTASPDVNDGTGVVIDLTIQGTPESGAYFAPDEEAFVIVRDQVAEGGADLFPDLVDPFGTPILAWQRDPFARAPFVVDPGATLSGGQTRLARVNAGSNESVSQGNRAAFYLAQNEGWLASPFYSASLIGPKKSGDNRVLSASLIFGHPSFPEQQSLNDADRTSTVGVKSINPAALRGDIIFHSAGRGAQFMEDRSGNTALVDSVAFYGVNFISGAGNFDSEDFFSTRYDDRILAIGGGGE